MAGVAAALPGAPSKLETFSDWISADPKRREAGVQACLDRIKSEDGAIHAWVQVQPQEPAGTGKLLEIPFAAKDIMETRGLSTEYGSPVYKGRIGTADAAIVQDLRRRGAVLLGKTHTTAFAYRDPGPTRNPRNLDHTPGGSSSGSAAAVAAGMVPFALGTQTGGSVLRPASFCGVTGFKPTYGLIPTDGVLQFAKSLDTVGFFTNTPADMLALWSALDRPTGLEKGGEDETFAIAAPDPMPEVEPEMAAAFQGALSSLASRGASIRKVNIAALLVKLTEANRVLMYYEGARFHQQRYQEFGDRLGSMAALVREGLQIPQSHYNETRRFIAESQAHLVELYKATPIILVPAATGPAPLGLSSTGDSRMNAPWTALGTPAISIPMPVAGKLPLGLQLTGAPGDDARVLRTALRLDRILSSK
jgi:Asp-tRNA(Asn)/Glu-tRNA(Gln) amidotransferase A subunit family amidase